ncbi:hypothetical protein HYH03_006045 [Edaphochlamys debaryana]|uniref:Uncharacterized protein n=1 Tax=Edaphochlamys debaryana TaxID=47281 RepID=A0A835Y6U0_9CHLO|nr:hypothetical protein HYH03_006045 [Edaphochlamys debaryana]|eukprot:KAG2495803.1 hypothetical protein HYH03_006045 [Edaphochlamys debaryana]
MRYGGRAGEMVITFMGNVRAYFAKHWRGYDCNHDWWMRQLLSYHPNSTLWSSLFQEHRASNKWDLEAPPKCDACERCDSANCRRLQGYQPTQRVPIPAMPHGYGAGPNPKAQKVVTSMEDGNAPCPMPLPQETKAQLLGKLQQERLAAELTKVSNAFSVLDMSGE